MLLCTEEIQIMSEIIDPYVCPYDGKPLTFKSVKKVYMNRTPYNVDLYICKHCNRKYVLSNHFKDMVWLKIGSERIIHLSNVKSKVKHNIKIKKKGVKYSEVEPLQSMSEHRNVSRCSRNNRGKCVSVDTLKKFHREECGINKCTGHINKVNILIENKKVKYVQQGARQCHLCGILFITNQTYNINRDAFELVESVDFVKRAEAKKEAINEKVQIGNTNLKMDPSTIMKRGAYQMKFVYQPPNPSESTSKGHNHSHQNVSMTLDFLDCVVRRNTFKCMHNEHRLHNVDAEVEVIEKKTGLSRNKKIAAGYCEECKLFFIMESVYQQLIKKYIVCCRVFDEKTYLGNSDFDNGMMLANESILKQYGYNVSQTEGLSTTARRKILSNLVDRGTMTRNDIIGYIDFFIALRRSDSKFERALSKWEDDKDYISQYRMGDYSSFGINYIHRKY